MEGNWAKVTGIVEQGHQVASGRSPNSPYPAGTIELQKPFFRELGLDLSGFFDGTLNVSIRPYTFTLTNPQFTFRQVNWIPGFPPEDFSFSPCQLIFNGRIYDCWLYYPHPETKTKHFQDPTIIEIIAPYIPDISYGDKVKVMLNREELTLQTAVWLEAVDFLAKAPTPQQIIEFKLSPVAQERLEELLDGQRSNDLTPLELAELATYRQINSLFVVLKARARTSSDN